MATEAENKSTPAPETKEIKEEAESQKGAEDVGKQEPAAGDAPNAPKEKEPAPPKVLVHKANFEKDVVYLYQFSRTPLLPSLSPFCLKVESWLRLAGVKYENVDHKMKYRSKKGQLPFIEVNGEEIADSTIIIKELAQRYNHDLDAALTAEQRNVAHATISMVENHLAFVVMWWRTKYPDLLLKGYKVNLQHALGSRIPNGILNFCFKFAFGRKWLQGAKKVKAQGIGVHSAEEINSFGQSDLKVLSDMLADKPFFFGDEPTNLDVVVFSLLAQIYFIDKEVSYALRDYMTESCPNLVGLVNRMKERCFPDWDDICTTLDLNSHLPKPVPEDKDNKEAGKDEKESQEKEPDDKDIEKEKADEKEKDKAKEKETEENKEKETK